jgi:hypothetical protein
VRDALGRFVSGPSDWKGKKRSKAFREKCRLGHLGRKREPLSEEHKRKIGLANSKALKGKILPNDHKGKISKSVKKALRDNPEIAKKRARSGEAHWNWKGRTICPDCGGAKHKHARRCMICKSKYNRGERHPNW